MLIAADHLLPHISSNPLISRPLDGSTDPPHSLEIYMDSMRLTRAIDLDIVLPATATRSPATPS